MFDFIFDPETNGIVLQESEKPLRREIRPVYCHVVDYNMIGLNKRLIGRNTRRFMCLHCLAEFFGTSESVLQHKIDEFRDDGCALFK